MFNVPVHKIQERRSKPRINCSFPACVHLGNHSGIKFETQAILSNMSANGLYLQMGCEASLEETIFVFVRMSAQPLNQDRCPKIAIQGKIVRVDTNPDGFYGIAIQLENYCFL